MTAMVEETDSEALAAVDTRPLRPLTARQRAFVNAYLSNGMNALQATIAAGFSEKAARSYGSQLLAKPQVQAAIVAEQVHIADVNGIEVGHHIRELEKLRDRAAGSGAYAAAVNAEVKRGEVLGFYNHLNAGGQGGNGFQLNLIGIGRADA